MFSGNKMSSLQYCSANILFAFICIRYSEMALFMKLEGITHGESKIVFYLFFIGIFLISSFIINKNQRNRWSIFLNSLLPIGLYTIWAYKSYRTELIKTLLIIVGFLSAVYMVLLFKKRIRNIKQRQKIIYNRVCACFRVCALLMIISSVIIMGSVRQEKALKGHVSISASVSPIQGNEKADDMDIESRKSVISMFRETKWKTLTLEEKINALQEIANIEACSLGLPNKLMVETTNDIDDYTMAYYDHDKNIIMMNLNNLLASSGKELLQNVLHESWHSYEYNLVEVYNKADEEMKSLVYFYKPSIYEYEFTNYITGSSDFDGYYNQECETDARMYAESRYLVYAEYIE